MHPSEYIYLCVRECVYAPVNEGGIKIQQEICFISHSDMILLNSDIMQTGLTGKQSLIKCLD